MNIGSDQIILSQLKPRAHLLILIFTFLTSVYAHWDIFTKDLIGVHLWRQVQNQWNIRNFYREDNNILNPRIAAHNLGHEGNILRYEFPLMQWSIAQVQRVAGESIGVTRWCMFFTGWLGILGFYALSLVLFRNKILAACGAWILTFSPLFYYYTMNPMSDIQAMAAQIWMMVFSIKFYRDQKWKDLIWCAVLLCLTGLFKLPYFIFGVMPLAAVLLIYFNQSGSKQIFIKSIFLLILSSLPVAAWYIYSIRSWESMGVLQGIFGLNDINAIPGYFKFHLTYWLPLYLINPAALLFFILGIVTAVFKKGGKSGNLVLLVSGAMVGLIYYAYEINMISTVHDYYMLPFLVWLHLMVLYGLYNFQEKYRINLITILLMAFMPVLTCRQINDHFWSLDRNGYNVDWFKFNDQLKQAVPRDSLCIFLNDNTGVVMPYEVDKQGYVFDKDELPIPWIEDMIINRRARYMYSDSRKVDTSEEVKPFLDTLLTEAGRVRVFRLVEPGMILNGRR